MDILFITVNLIQEYTSFGETAAQRNLRKVRKAYNIPAYKEVNVFVYCDYYNIDVDRFIAFIEALREKKAAERKRHRLGGEP